MGLGSLDDLELIDVLMSLPGGLQVERGCLAEREQRILRPAPHRAVDEPADISCAAWSRL
ncbi:hypothetical protein [Nocardia sp. NBC_01009]|uniref:hypothetical protein n=1 Tax=Nocardia sp. NBC_01009 TaxID=2975996 RepID=UPI003868453C|nr:hypothetical protein OHA42_17650 [Nocardia sp. NBC_01009]